jgi:hypothetical protein
MANKDDGFGHIYYDDWKIGFEYERRIRDNIEYLGKVISKEAIGPPYNQDISIKFEKNGEKYTHIIAFDHSYRLKKY